MSEDCHDSENGSRAAPEHELTGMGLCANDCRACAWHRKRHLVMREALRYPPAPMVLTDADARLLAAMHVTWEGDSR